MKRRPQTTRFSPAVFACGLLLALLAISAPAVAAAAPVTAAELGLRTDGSDQSAVLQRLLDRGGIIALPAGTFVAGGLRAHGGTTLVGVPGRTVIKQPPGTRYVLSVNPGTGGTPDPADNEAHIRIRGITFEGRVVEDGFEEHDHVLNLNAVSDVLIENCIVRGFRGDGLYLGSGNRPNLERHNRDVTIRNCLFDGINRNNRHGIFVVDGTHIRIENNVFVNCTRFGQPGYMAGTPFDRMDPESGPSMPGPLNIEPDGYPFSVVRNIAVTGNTFRNSTGVSGTIQIYLALRDFATAPNHFLIADNYIDETNRSIGIHLYAAGSAGPDRPAMNIRVIGNTILGTWRGLEIKGIHGAVIRDNVIAGTGSSPLFGYRGDHGNRDLLVEDNLFRDIARDTGGGIAVFANHGLAIRDNRITDAHGNAFTFHPALSSRITLEGNVLSSPRGVTRYGFRNNGHTFDKTTNRAGNNLFLDGIAGDDFPAANRSRFLAHPGEPQSLPAGAPTIIAFAAEAYDQAGDFARSTFTAPAAACYALLVQTGLRALPAGTAGRLALRKNGSLVAEKTFRGGPGGEAHPALALDDCAAAGDRYEVFVEHASDRPAELDGRASRSFFSGHRLND